MRTKHENKSYVPQFKHPGGQNPTKKKHLSKTKAESQIPASAGVCRWLRKNLNLSGYLVCISYANIGHFHEEPVIKHSTTKRNTNQYHLYKRISLCQTIAINCRPRSPQNGARV